MSKQRVHRSLTLITGTVVCVIAITITTFSLLGEKVEQATSPDHPTALTTSEAEDEYVPIPPPGGLELLTRVLPEYPAEAKKTGISGIVICRVCINPLGRVISIKIMKSPNEIFNEPTIEAVKQWRYRNKNAESIVADIHVRYVLRGELEKRPTDLRFQLDVAKNGLEPESISQMPLYYFLWQVQLAQTQRPSSG